MSQVRERWPPQGLPGARFLYGTLATRPAFGILNRYYWATDTFTLFRDTGVAWEIAGFEPAVRYLSNYQWLHAQNATDNVVPIIGRVYLMRLDIPYTMTLDRSGYVKGAIIAGNLYIGIYREGATRDSPAGGALAVQAGPVAMDAGIQLIQWVNLAATRLVGGPAWVAVEFSDNTARLHRACSDAQLDSYTTDLGAFGPLPDTCPAVADSIANFGVYLRADSVP
jgi:hypothetical protein